MTDNIYLLPIKETLKAAWERVYGAKATMWGAFVIIFIIMFGFGFLSGIIKAFVPAIYPVLNFIVQLVSFLLEMGLLYIGIRRAQDSPINYKLVFKCFEARTAGYIICVYILEFLIIIIPAAIATGGSFLFSSPQTSLNILGGFLIVVALIAIYYLFIRMMMAVGFVLDKNSSPWEAIKQSFAITKGNAWRLFLLVVIQTLFVAISAIPLLIGLIWTLPFSLIMYGVMYRSLLEKKTLTTSVNTVRAQ